MAPENAVDLTQVDSHWWFTLDRAGYFGAYALGALYQFSNKHETELSVGFANTGGITYGQINGSYRYSPWLLQIHHNQLWKPLQIGGWLIYSMDSNEYFVTSPSQYPGSSYYDTTAIRGGLETGTTYQFEKWRLEFSYRLRLIDLGITALYNNSHRDLQYYVSSGAEIHYRF